MSAERLLELDWAIMAVWMVVTWQVTTNTLHFWGYTSEFVYKFCKQGWYFTKLTDTIQGYGSYLPDLMLNI